MDQEPRDDEPDADDAFDDEPVAGYPSLAVPVVSAAGALITLAALGYALIELEPYTWALAPFVFVFAALPYFALALRARSATRPSSQLLLTVAALLVVSAGAYVYFVDVVTAAGAISVGTFLSVPLWQTLLVAATLGVVRLLEPARRGAGPVMEMDEGASDD